MDPAQLICCFYSVQVHLCKSIHIEEAFGNITDAKFPYGSAFVLINSV